MPNKRQFINKKNAKKFVLLPGQANAVNADGEALPSENILVPVPSNYKAGSALLLAGLPSSCNPTLAEHIPQLGENSKEIDLEKLLSNFDDCSDFDDESSVLSGMKQKKISSKNISHKYSDVHIEMFEEDSDCSNESDNFCEDFDDPSSNITKSSLPEDCPENLKILNERFNKLLDDEYDTEQIGALDFEEIGGCLTTQSEQVKDWIELQKEEVVDIGECDEELKQKIVKYSEMDEPTKLIDIEIVEKAIEWDCESILSTYSNKYNHPVIIKVDSKIKIPTNPLKKKLTKSVLKQLESLSENEEEEEFDRASMTTSCYNVRPKEETPEQRKERKTMLKEMKREIRILKKENKLAFKEERKMQKNQVFNLRNNIGIKLM